MTKSVAAQKKKAIAPKKAKANSKKTAAAAPKPQPTTEKPATAVKKAQSTYEYWSVDHLNKRSIHNQICENIISSVASADFKDGDKLPAIREMSEYVGVNLNTTAKAYRELTVSGVLYSRRGKGVFVAEGGQKAAAALCEARLKELMTEALDIAECIGMSGKKLLNLGE